ncbi:MAG: dephospho-CoA kinase [Odoribacteraceae bacterium]|jgi:dephospho-CoA kinase|nr:dephospho-CoA kinase [Odoribacteraceae bacterium]
MLKIGLTGGIGSGKTTVSGIIQELGYPVYHSDAAAARIANEEAAVREALVEAFGAEYYNADGTLDRPRLASLIFNNAEALARANAIIHPAVTGDFQRWSLSRDEPLVFFESAILFEAGLAGLFDAVITVVADEETRVERVMLRDRVPREKVMERLKHQTSNAAQSRFIVYNNRGDMLVEQLLQIIQILEQW